MQFNQNQANLQNRAAATGLYEGLGSNDYQKKLSLAQYIQSIMQPVVGLDPGSVVDLSVGNANNAANAAQQQAAIQAQEAANRSQLMGQTIGAMGSIAGSYFGNRPATTTTTPTRTPYTGMGSTAYGAGTGGYAGSVPYLQKQNYSVAPKY
jgi:hypothetical protein